MLDSDILPILPIIFAAIISAKFGVDFRCIGTHFAHLSLNFICSKFGLSLWLLKGSGFETEQSKTNLYLSMTDLYPHQYRGKVRNFASKFSTTYSPLRRSGFEREKPIRKFKTTFGAPMSSKFGVVRPTLLRDVARTTLPMYK